MFLFLPAFTNSVQFWNHLIILYIVFLPLLLTHMWELKKMACILANLIDVLGKLGILPTGMVGSGLGWLNQSSKNNFRWMLKSPVFKIFLSSHHRRLFSLVVSFLWASPFLHHLIFWGPVSHIVFSKIQILPLSLFGSYSWTQLWIISILKFIKMLNRCSPLPPWPQKTKQLTTNLLS